MEGFQSDFDAYLERMGVQLSKEAKVLQAEIDNLLKEIDGSVYYVTPITIY